MIINVLLLIFQKFQEAQNYQIYLPSLSVKYCTIELYLYLSLSLFGHIRLCNDLKFQVSFLPFFCPGKSCFYPLFAGRARRIHSCCLPFWLSRCDFIRYVCEIRKDLLWLTEITSFSLFSSDKQTQITNISPSRYIGFSGFSNRYIG